MTSRVASLSGLVIWVSSMLKRFGFDRIDVFTRQVEAAFAKHNAFNLSGEFNWSQFKIVCVLYVLNPDNLDESKRNPDHGAHIADFRLDDEARKKLASVPFRELAAFSGEFEELEVASLAAIEATIDDDRVVGIVAHQEQFHHARRGLCSISVQNLRERCPLQQPALFCRVFTIRPG